MATRPKMRKLVEKQIAKAIEGDVPAIKEILDRVDGRVPHAIAGDDDEGPINLVVTWKCNSRPSTAVLQLAMATNVAVSFSVRVTVIVEAAGTELRQTPRGCRGTQGKRGSAPGTLAGGRAVGGLRLGGWRRAGLSVFAGTDLYLLRLSEFFELCQIARAESGASSRRGSMSSSARSTSR